MSAKTIILMGGGGGCQPAQTGTDSKHPCACVASVNQFVSLLAQRLINILDQQEQKTKQI